MTLSQEEKRKILNDTKKQVYALEEFNDDHLYAYYTGDGWYKFGGNSALYLFHIFAEKIEGYQPRLKPDGDFNHRFVHGCISLRNLTQMAEKLAKIDIEKDEEFNRKYKYIKAFKLPKKISTKTLNKILGKDDLKKQELNETLSLAHADPEMAAQIREMQRRTFIVIKKISKIEREIVGDRLIDANTKLYLAYRDWANNAIQNELGLRKIIRIVDEIEGLMLIVMENDLVEIDEIAFLTFKTEEIRRAAQKRLELSSNEKVD